MVGGLGGFLEGKERMGEMANFDRLKKFSSSSSEKKKVPKWGPPVRGGPPAVLTRDRGRRRFILRSRSYFSNFQNQGEKVRASLPQPAQCTCTHVHV